ncbi:Phage minor capsid protein 2 [Streptoalloteichus tenebrarius]|uniref:Phage minor capsid protein 2 n=1 Tax=Streptoalloteichus tenebrarius (strain ATCC 17920 / DSM 40477 / JCM 4838 / CBS 697.72 / NBRC 16177 / NCIMB 11028 / NRRL B-12390 / A12253. 1 / ISP 5477) TaxID=1933 RepID=A0ABT1I016_STRSD|nr:phage minor capsid protein [Streptoalloteichus tenebrarius]MCP2261076.1 Phage minor capsid protein 2 [Streptoalloteichus tenebrarius]BFF03129.1 hypothetical protein GCM10020241_48040 [Streptoalloteichus tenebrarius]
MGVDPLYLDEIAATVAALYRQAEIALVRIIAGHLAGDLDDRDMQSPGWAETKLSAVRALRRSAQAVIAGVQADSSTALREAAAAAFRHGWTAALVDLPATWFPASGLAGAARQALTELPGFGAIEALAAAVHHDIGERSRNILRDSVDAYRSVITAASARVLTGVGTRRDAAQAAWRRLMDRGITAFTDSAGRRWQLSSYVEMATRTVAQRAAVQAQADRLTTTGISLVYVSDHGQECALCRPFEGRVLRLDGGPTGEITVPDRIGGEPVTVEVVATLAEAQVLGLFHPNCRHSISAYLPGVTRVPRQPTADPEGNRARQRQRAIERQIRKWRTREAGAVSDEERQHAKHKVAAWQAAMREHLKEHPKLKRVRYREQPGAGNIPKPGKNDPAGAIGPAVQASIDGRDDPATAAV